MKAWFCRALIGICAAAPAAGALADPVQKLAGGYKRTFQLALVNGERYIGAHRIEIVPVAPGAAFLRAELDFSNGHSCNLLGIAKAEGDALVFRPKRDIPNNLTCVLTVRRKGRDLSVDDGDGGCKSYCGSRGTMSGITMPLASRYRVPGVPALKRGEDFQETLKSWKEGRQ